MLRIVTALISVLSVISLWMIFEKSGEKGWKAVFPIYNYYICSKLAHCKKKFISLILTFSITVICFISSFLLLSYSISFSEGTATTNLSPYITYAIMTSFISMVLFIVMLVINAVINVKLTKIYGGNKIMEVLSGIGAFLPIIMIIVLCIIALSDKYQYKRT